MNENTSLTSFPSEKKMPDLAETSLTVCRTRANSDNESDCSLTEPPGNNRETEKTHWFWGVEFLTVGKTVLGDGPPPGVADEELPAQAEESQLGINSLDPGISSPVPYRLSQLTKGAKRYRTWILPKRFFHTPFDCSSPCLVPLT